MSEIRTDAIVTLRHAAEVNNAEANRCRADADKMQADANELRARAGWFTAMADRWDRIATFIENGTFDLDYLLSGDDLDEARRAGATQAPAAADEATEAFVDVADAERYALRDEYVNSADAERTTLAEQLRARGAEQAARDEEANVFAAQRRADEAEANGEYVDYDEADAVREIEREMAIEAGDDSEIDRQVAEDDARFERTVWLAQQEAQAFERHQANIARDSEGLDRAAHYGGMQCPGCPDCIGYADPGEADALDGVL